LLLWFVRIVVVAGSAGEAPLQLALRLSKGTAAETAALRKSFTEKDWYL
jgi:hypothetical protein